MINATRLPGLSGDEPAARSSASSVVVVSLTTSWRAVVVDWRREVVLVVRGSDVVEDRTREVVWDDEPGSDLRVVDVLGWIRLVVLVVLPVVDVEVEVVELPARVLVVVVVAVWAGAGEPNPRARRSATTTTPTAATARCRTLTKRMVGRDT
ncbi:MAG: hypothetical protein ACR2G7_05690 [Acidimicrobiales bacterium]